MSRALLDCCIAVALLAGLAAPVLAQPDPSASSSPAPSVRAGDDAGEPGSARKAPIAPDAGFAFREPRWQRLDAGPGPAGREDHTWTVDAEGDYAYLFGGRDGVRVFGDLWRYDLRRDAWQRLRPDGPRPAARFGHAALWVEDQGLVVLAGQQGSDFFGDLWTFDPHAGRWSELPDRGARPRPRYGSCALLGRDGRLWMSHGFTFAGRFDDTRAYHFGSRRWASVAPAGRRPGERCLHDCFTTDAGEPVLFGGQDDSNAALGDLWVMEAGGSWDRRPDPGLMARRLYALTQAGSDAWIFGGAGRDGAALGDLWRVDRRTLRFERVPVPGASPSARWAGTLVTDAAGGRLLLFGGQGREARDDLWQLIDLETASAAAPDPAATPAQPAGSPGMDPTAPA